MDPLAAACPRGIGRTLTAECIALLRSVPIGPLVHIERPPDGAAGHLLSPRPLAPRTVQTVHGAQATIRQRAASSGAVPAELHPTRSRHQTGTVMDQETARTHELVRLSRQIRTRSSLPHQVSARQFENISSVAASSPSSSMTGTGFGSTIGQRCHRPVGIGSNQ